MRPVQQHRLHPLWPSSHPLAHAHVTHYLILLSGSCGLACLQRQSLTSPLPCRYSLPGWNSTLGGQWLAHLASNPSGALLPNAWSYVCVVLGPANVWFWGQIVLSPSLSRVSSRRNVILKLSHPKSQLAGLCFVAFVHYDALAVSAPVLTCASCILCLDRPPLRNNTSRARPRGSYLSKQVSSEASASRPLYFNLVFSRILLFILSLYLPS